MGQLGAQVAEVTIESDWWSKINWTQVVGWVCSGLAIFTANRLEVTAEMQGIIVLMIQGIVGMLTIVLRRRSTTITPTAAELLKQQ
jgi:hypothetical protein